MEEIRVEVRNNSSVATAIQTFRGDDWEKAAREFVKSQASEVRKINGKAEVWAMFFRSGSVLCLDV